MSGKTLLVIAGPTAVGKTALAITVAQALGTEILSADSRQCYRGMAVGTAQPTPKELTTVRHRFINELPVEAAFTAADYERYGLAVLAEVFEKSDIAIACGGTGLYLKALCDGLDETPATEPAVVAGIQAEYAAKGISWLQERLREEDPRTFAAIDHDNPSRLLRALAFYRSTGLNLVSFQTGTTKQRPFRIVRVALELPRATLYDRINARVDGMMAAGLLEEARSLYEKRHLKALQTVGYAELFRYLDGEWTLEQSVDKIKQHTRNYAKRQLTWFRNDGSYRLLPAGGSDVISQLLESVRA